MVLKIIAYEPLWTHRVAEIRCEPGDGGRHRVYTFGGHRSEKKTISFCDTVKECKAVIDRLHGPGIIYKTTSAD